MPSPFAPSAIELPSLLYVEDEKDIADIAVEILAQHYRVHHVTTGEDALTVALQRRFDVMVVDRRLPGMSGADFVHAVRTAHLATPVLMLTALGTVEDRVSGLDIGADDYLVKPFDFTELLARLRALRRGSRAAGERREIAGWSFTPRAQALYGPDGRRVSLTSTENDLLELLTSSPEHVFTREEILATVFSEEGSVSTVDAYVHYIRRKSTPELIETVRLRGYRSGDAT